MSDKLKCEICGKELLKKKNLEIHIEKKHNTIFKCEKCNKEFKRKENLIYHLKNKCNIDTEKYKVEEMIEKKKTNIRNTIKNEINKLLEKKRINIYDIPDHINDIIKKNIEEYETWLQEHKIEEKDETDKEDGETEEEDEIKFNEKYTSKDVRKTTDRIENEPNTIPIKTKKIKNIKKIVFDISELMKQNDFENVDEQILELLYNLNLGEYVKLGQEINEIDLDLKYKKFWFEEIFKFHKCFYIAFENLSVAYEEMEKNKEVKIKGKHGHYLRNEIADCLNIIKEKYKFKFTKFQSFWYECYQP